MTGTGTGTAAVLATDSVVPCLRRGLLDVTTQAMATRLAGGVSGDVLAVDAGGTQMVVKQALPQLRVQAEWNADPDRILTEAAALRLAAISPDAVPPVIDIDPDRHVIVMGREAAEALNAPLYLHPQSPPPAVREAYYSGFGGAADAALATFGIGWHHETGVQLLRLILSDVFDRFPSLQVITGHWGEVVLFSLERIEGVAAASALDPSEVHRLDCYQAVD